MKLKNLALFLFAALFAFALCACGGDSASGGTPAPDPAEDPAVEAPETPEVPETPEEFPIADPVFGNDASYNLDYEDWNAQDMSADRVPLEKVKAVFESIGEMSKEERAEITYPDLIKEFGCDPSSVSIYSYSDTGQNVQQYYWHSEEDENDYFAATFIREGDTLTFSSHLLNT